MKGLEEDIEKAVKAWEASVDQRSQEGHDWFQLMQSEEEVFDIETARWARMMAAWECYEGLIDIVEPQKFDKATIAAERKKWPKLKLHVSDVSTFTDFAVARAGLTTQEAWAVFYKVLFWQIRNGLVFRDKER